MAKNICKSQFKLANFGVGNVPMEDFYTFEWWNCRISFAIFRTVMLAWSLAWLIYFWANQKHNYHYNKLTNWTELYVFLYYLSAFIVAVYGTIKRKQPLPSTPGLIRVFQGMTWIFQSTSFCCLLIVVILYWTFIASIESNIASARNVYVHAIIFVTFLLDFFVVAIPVRLLHFVYVLIGALAYALLLIIWFFVAAEPKNVIYSFADFETKPISASLIITCLVVLGPFIAQSVLFFLFWLKTLCSKRDHSDKSSNIIMEETVITNTAVAAEKNEKLSISETVP